MAAQSFAAALLEQNFSETEVAIGLLWLDDREGGEGLSPKDIGSKIREAGGSAINTSRLKEGLKKSRNVIASGTDKFRIRRQFQKSATEIYSVHSTPIRPLNSGSVLDPQIFSHARKYVQNIAWQINASYDAALFDCCAVMCRRLLETLIIDAFEHQGAIDLLRDANGDIHRLSAIMKVVKGSLPFSVSRHLKNAPEDLKNIGDWAAHSRTFITRVGHINKISGDFSAIAMELLHLAGQD